MIENPPEQPATKPSAKDDSTWMYSLKKRMLFGLLSLFVAATLATAVFITNRASNLLAESTARNTRELGDTIKSSLRILMLKRNPQMIQTLLNDVGKDRNTIVKAFILDNTGRIEYSTEKEEIGRTLNRFEEQSCRICHREIEKAPSSTTIIFESNGVKIQRNVDVIFNEKVCHQCHAAADRIRGKVVIDRSLSRAEALVSSLKLIVFSGGMLCLVIVVPFVFRQVNRYIAELQKALAEIKTLHGILPICTNCKKILDDKGSWEQLEGYISSHTDAAFSHGYCPECAAKALKEFEELTKKKNP